MKRMLSTLVAASTILFCSVALSDDGFFRPTSGNLYITNTDRFLYIIWAVPRDLRPFAHIHQQPALDAYLMRTAVFLCTESRARARATSRDCKVQLVQMNSNDEYTRSATGGFRTIARMLLPMTSATSEVHRRVQTQGVAEVRALFTQFELRPGSIPMTGR